jgi:hypothetical protein
VGSCIFVYHLIGAKRLAVGIGSHWTRVTANLYPGSVPVSQSPVLSLHTNANFLDVLLASTSAVLDVKF